MRNFLKRLRPRMSRRTRSIYLTAIALLVIVTSIIGGGTMLALHSVKAHSVTNAAVATTIQNKPTPSAFEPTGAFGLPSRIYGPIESDALRGVKKIVVTVKSDMLPKDIVPFQYYCSASFVGEQFGPTNGTMVSAGHCYPLKEAKDYYDKLCHPEKAKSDDSNSSDEDSGMKGAEDSSAQLTSPCPTPMPASDDYSMRFQVMAPYDQQGSCPGYEDRKEPVDAHPLGDFTSSENGDISYLKVDGMVCAPVLPVATHEPGPGEQVVSVGFAAGLDADSMAPDRSTSESGSPYTSDPGKLAKDYTNVRYRVVTSVSTFSGKFFAGDSTAIGGMRAGSGTQFNGNNGALIQGMSGGPLLVMEGGKLKLAGINSFTTGQLGFTVSLGTIILGLRAHGIKFEDTGATAKAPSSTRQVDLVSSKVDSNDVTAQMVMEIRHEWQLFLLFVAVVMIGLFIRWLFQRRSRTTPVQTTPASTVDQPDTVQV